MFELAVVGAGPAGMAAATAAAAEGARVVVIDEQRRPGGQIFRQLPPEFAGSPHHLAAGYPWAQKLLDTVEHADRITWMQETTVFGVFRDDANSTGDFQLAVSSQTAPGRLVATKILIATGAYDLPVAFPGWTLPGVMMTGAVQSLIKSQRLLVSDPIVLVGSHPLMIVAADQLLAAGANIAEVAFARGVPTLLESLGSLSAIPGHIGLFVDTAAALARLARAKVKISTHTVVTKATGNDHVDSVELARVNADWRITGGRRTVPASTLILGYGFQASTELARQAACEMLWSSPKGGWVVAHDANMATSVPGIFVAGEPTGIAGADQARAEGHLAGLTITQELGLGTDIETKVSRAKRSVERTSRFARAVQTIFEQNRPALASLATPDTITCRCELVTRDQVDAVLAANPHLSSVSAVKLECRSGMGPCQGRYCEMTVSSLVSAARDMPMQDVGYFNAHVPVKPVPLSAYTSLDEPPTT